MNTANMPMVGYDCEHDRDDSMADEVLSILLTAYPGYDWFVTIRSGVMHIKILTLSDRWGMALHYNDIKHNAGARKKDIIRAAGEFLERANLHRGKARRDALKRIEGVPQRHLDGNLLRLISKVI